MRKFYDCKQNIKEYYTDFYTYIYLNFEEEEERNLYFNYINSFECDKTISSREFLSCFFVTIYTQMRYEKNIDLNMQKYIKKFDDLNNFLNNNTIHINMINDYDVLNDNIKNMENDIFNENQNDEIQNLNEEELEDILNEKIFTFINLNLSFYDYLCFFNNNGKFTHINIFTFLIFIKYLNNINDLSIIHFPKKPCFDLNEHIENFLSLCLVIDRINMYDEDEDEENENFNNSFISYYISFKHTLNFEIEHCLNDENKELIKNLFYPEIELFEKRLVELNINLIPFPINFNLDNYTFFVRDIYQTNSNYLKILYFKNLHNHFDDSHIENSPILKMVYFNIFIRCVNNGEYFEAKKNNDNLYNYCYHDIPNKKITPVELNTWIQQVKNEVFTIDPFVENFSKDLMNFYLENLYTFFKINNKLCKECVICLVETDENDENDNNLCCFQCKNIFHEKCIKEWFKKTISTNCPVCPMCRKNMYSVFMPNYELYKTFYQLLLN